MVAGAIGIKHLYTVDDFADFLAQSGEKRYELIHGEVVEKMPTEQHGVISLKVGARLLTYVEDHDIPAHVGVEVRHQKPKDRYNSRLPDISLRLTNEPTVKDGAVLQMPDLAVEIQSPDDTVRELREKAHYYLYNGTRLVWLIYPDSQTAEICQLDPAGDISIISIEKDSFLEASPILADFRLALASIFPR